MRLALLVSLVLSTTACLAELDDLDDPAWEVASDPDAAAAREEVAAAEVTIDAVDDTDDPAELDGTADGEDDEPGVLEAAARFRNPLGPACADPGAIKVAGSDGPTFWVACTGKGFPLFRSRDLVHWTAAGHLFSSATKPAWANGNWWAPEIHRVGEGFVAYFTALSPSRGKMCIGAARAATMAGPWRDLGHPLVCDAHVSLIDATVHRAATGALYLYYKTDGNGLRPQEKTVIYGQALRADGVALVGARRALIANTLAWEGDVVEAPWIHHRGGYYYLFYSGFRYCNATYGTGVARSRSPLGPFVKRSRPILASNAAWSGPGHNSIVRTGGSAWIVYHAWSGAHTCSDAGARKLLLDPIRWTGGWPVIGNGTPTRDAQPAPLVP